MTNETLKIRLQQAAQSSDDFVYEIYELVEELEVPPSLDHVRTIIGFMEQNPDVDYGAVGPLTNYIEKLDTGTYSKLVIESVRARPTMHTIGMLNRCINALRGVARLEALTVLKGVANDADVGDWALKLLDFQQKKEPDPHYFAMRVRIERETQIFFSFADFEKFLAEFDFKTERSFWLSPGSPEYPAWNMIRRDDLVYLHFFPSDLDAGFHLRAASYDIITFHADGFDLDIQKGSLTNPATALRIIQQYFEQGTLATDLDWEEL